MSDDGRLWRRLWWYAGGLRRSHCRPLPSSVSIPARERPGMVKNVNRSTTKCARLQSFFGRNTAASPAGRFCTVKVQTFQCGMKVKDTVLIINQVLKETFAGQKIGKENERVMIKSYLLLFRQLHNHVAAACSTSQSPAACRGRPVLHRKAKHGRTIYEHGNTINKCAGALTPEDALDYMKETENLCHCGCRHHKPLQCRSF